MCQSSVYGQLVTFGAVLFVIAISCSVGSYYDYDSSRHLRRSSVMADQCAGQWYLFEVGIKDVSLH